MNLLKPKIIYRRKNKNKLPFGRLSLIFLLVIIAIFAVGRLMPLSNIQSIYKINFISTAHSEDGGDAGGGSGGDTGGGSGGDTGGGSGGDTGGGPGGDGSGGSDGFGGNINSGSGGDTAGGSGGDATGGSGGNTSAGSGGDTSAGSGGNTTAGSGGDTQVITSPIGAEGGTESSASAPSPISVSGPVEDSVSTPASTPATGGDGGVGSAPSCTLTLTPSTMLLNENSTLAWVSSDADSGDIQPGIGNVSSDGSQAVSPTSTTQYSGIFTNAFGSGTCQVLLTVNTLPGGGTGPSCSIAASPSSITQGAASTLSWSASNASSTIIDNGIGNVFSTDSLDVSPANTTTYTATATNQSGTANCSVTIVVTPPSGGGGGGAVSGAGPSGGGPALAALTTFRSEPGGQVLGSYITLTQVPYTGFGDNFETTLFILTLFFGSGVLANQIVRKRTTREVAFRRLPLLSKEVMFKAQRPALRSIFLPDTLK